jgi:phosphosulfolactate synthase (CoM biosynthesis protein A)
MYSLNYFNRIGKVELCRLIFKAANVDYKDNYISNLTDSGNLNNKNNI